VQGQSDVPTSGAAQLDADAARTAAPGTAALHAVVVTFNSARALVGLLPTLDRGLAGTTWRLTVVDNDSSDDTVATVRDLRPDAHVIEMGRNAGYAAAINAAARASAPDETLLVLNPDTRLKPGCGATLVAETAREGVGIAVPRLLDEHGETWPSLRRAPSVRGVWAEALLGGRRASRRGLGEVVAVGPAYDEPHPVAWATGAVLAVSPDCRAAVGDWDESFFLYSEEVDYCDRARAAGFEVRYTPAAVAEHSSGPYGENVGLWRLVVRNRIVHYARHHDRVRSHLFRAGVLANEVLRAPRRASARAGAAEAWSTPLRDRAEPGFIWFAAQDWWYHNRAHSDFQLMQQVARDRPVLLVNSLGLRLPRKGVSTHPARRISRKLRSMAKLVRRPVDGLPGFHVMTPVMLPAYGDGALARANAWLVRQQVRAVARAVGVGPRPLVAATIPTAWPVVRHLRRRALLYNRSDQHSAFPEADQAWVAGLEESLLRHADAVLYVSHELMAADEPLVGDRGVFLGHGVDLDHFSDATPAEEPAELAEIPRPIMGFFGGLDDYVVDMALLAETARAVPEASLVLIGDATCPMDELTALPNVHWLGFQPYSRIPAFGRAFDVALMPWLDNEWIRFANPIKLKEYLALGLPVVSTRYPELEHSDDPVLVAPTRADFPTLVRAALAGRGGHDAEAARAAVQSSSWAARAEHLMSIALTTES
jgi:GT2 family glycosyltransferase